MDLLNFLNSIEGIEITDKDIDNISKSIIEIYIEAFEELAK